MAREHWENHLARNRSVVVDLFYGQLKSKVTCKVCGNESVRCDPFFNLSLPLPMERCVSVEGVVILQDGATPVKYGLSLDMEDRCSVIPPKLARLCGVAPANLVLVDIVQSQVRVLPTHEQKVRSLSGSCIYAYEVPRLSETGVTSTNTSTSSTAAPSSTVVTATPATGTQSIPDIQRAVHSSMLSPRTWITFLTFVLCAELKGKNGVPDEAGEGAGGVEVSTGTSGSWSKHCMSGITLCFKVE